ncbi:MAG: tail fiber domain-containing protein [Desulfobulbaceae bacterium]|nr:tail fiber domain-containing protein [Desulfobulbaceae bacterium]
MKKTILIVLVLLFSTTYLLAQIPQTISWQGILQDSDAENLSGTYSLTVKLFDVSSGGSALWSETHSNTAIANGLVNLTLGSVTPFGVNFDDEYWLEITVGSGTPLPRIKLSSVPYSLHSKSADLFNETDPTWSGDANINSAISRNGNVGIGISTPNALLHTNGAGTGEGNILFTGELKISDPGAPPVEGAGTRMMWYPDKAAFRAGGVSGTQWDKSNIGFNSFASGLSTKASSYYTTALGFHSVASENYATAIGQQTTASGISSTALGSNTIASGEASTAMGSFSDATGIISTAMGYSTTASGGTSTAMGYNTIASGDYSTAMGNSSNASGVYSTALGNKTTASNGTSTAMGYSTTASGGTSTAMGYSTTASGGTSTAMGYSAIASGDYSTAMGNSSNASGLISTAMGSITTASGDYSTAMGRATTASGEFSTATGVGANASGTASTAIGRQTIASGYVATAIGHFTTASGNFSTTMGNSTKALSYAETAIGVHNTAYTPNSETEWIENDRLFVIGNGTAYNSLSNALTILKNGNTGLGTDTPSALLHTSGTGKGEGNVLFVGEYKSSDPGDPPVSGAGSRMMWYPDKVAFRAGKVSSTQWDKDNIGNYSNAIGVNITASGYASNAMGMETTASGYASTAMGGSTIASGEYSTAMGRITTASGNNSTTMGYHTTASGYTSIAMGSFTQSPSAYESSVGCYNTIYTPASTTAWNSSDRIFVVGNGANVSSRSNALTILKSGNTGIGTSTPSALLHTSGSGTGGGNVLFAGEYKSTASQGSPPATGAGTRMMWYPDKAAFRAGRVASTEWDKDSIGDYSVAFGYSAIAKSLSSVAIGAGTIANGPNSTALGAYTTASGKYSSAIGYQLNAKSYSTTAIGQYNVGFGDSQNWYSTDPIFEIGIGINESNKTNAMTVLKNGNIGIGTINPGGNRLRVLSNASGGTNSTGFFENTNGSGLALRATTNSSDGTILSIQEGEGYSLRCDGYDPDWFVAMIVKGRQVGINTSAPTQKLDVNGNARFRSIGSGAYFGVVNRTSDGTLTTATSDIRFKENILTLDNSLDRVKQLRGVSFTWKSNPEYGTRIGFVAQEFEKVVPELAFTNPTDGYMGINYAEMTAVLVEAMKEQQTIIGEQNKRIENLEKKIEILFQQVSNNK